MGSKLICVVDDDPSVRRAVSRLMGSYGLTVKTFSSAEEYLDASHPEGVACLILDVYMGGMSGLDLHERLTAEVSDAPPVIFITAHDDATTRDRVARSGAIAYFRKPFESAALLAAVGHAISRDLESPSI